MPTTLPMPLPPSVPHVTLTLRQVLDAQPALQRLANEKLPVKLAYTVARLLRALQPELEEFFKQRAALITQYGVTRPATEAERPQHGDEVTEVPASAMAEFRRDVDELAAVTITIDRAPLKMEGFPDMTPADLIALGPLLDEGAG